MVFEHLLQDPVAVMAGIYDWLGLPAPVFDPNNLTVKPHESDSYYRFKYLHKTHGQIKPPHPHLVPKRIQQQLQQQFAWFYETFYPGASRA